MHTMGKSRGERRVIFSSSGAMQTAQFPLRRLLRRIEDGGKRRQPHRPRLTLARLPTAAAVFCGARDGHGEGRWAKEAAERDQDVEAMDRRNTAKPSAGGEGGGSGGEELMGGRLRRDVFIY